MNTGASWDDVEKCWAGKCPLMAALHGRSPYLAKERRDTIEKLLSGGVVVPVGDLNYQLFRQMLARDELNRRHVDHLQGRDERKRTLRNAMQRAKDIKAMRKLAQVGLATGPGRCHSDVIGKHAMRYRVRVNQKKSYTAVALQWISKDTRTSILREFADEWTLFNEIFGGMQTIQKRQIIPAIDRHYGLLLITCSRSVHFKKIHRRVIRLLIATGVSAFPDDFNVGNTVHIAVNSRTRKTYIGQTSQGGLRFTGHEAAARNGTKMKLYSSSFHDYVFVPLVNLDRARAAYSNAVDAGITRKHREFVEGMVISMIRPSENAECGATLKNRGVAAVLNVDPNRTAGNTFPKDWTPSAIIEKATETLHCPSRFYESESKMINDYIRTGLVPRAHTFITELGRKLDEVSATTVNTVRKLGSRAIAKLIRQANTRLDPAKAFVVKQNLRATGVAIPKEIERRRTTRLPIKHHVPRDLKDLKDILTAHTKRPTVFEIRQAPGKVHLNMLKTKRSEIGANDRICRCRRVLDGTDDTNTQNHIPDFKFSVARIPTIEHEGEQHVFAKTNQVEFWNGYNNSWENAYKRPDLGTDAKLRFRMGNKSEVISKTLLTALKISDPRVCNKGKKKGKPLPAELRISDPKTEAAANRINELGKRMADADDKTEVFGHGERDVIHKHLAELTRAFYCSEVDKGVGISIACPMIYQAAVGKMLESSYVAVEGRLEDEPQDDAGFWDLLKGSGNRRECNFPRRRVHETPVLRLSPKERSFKAQAASSADVAWRPITGTRTHMYGNAYSLAARAARHILRTQFPGNFGTISEMLRHVNGVNILADEIDAENDTRSRNERTEAKNFTIRAADLKDYFTKTSVTESLKNWDRIAQRIKLVRPGTTYVMIRRAGVLFRPHGDTGGSSFRRTMLTNAKQNLVTTTMNRPDPRFYFYASLDALTAVLAHAVRYSYARANGRVYRQVAGGPMGVAVTEILCQLQTTLIEEVSKVGRSPAHLLRSGRDTLNKYVDDSLLQLLRANDGTHRPWILEDYYHDGKSGLRNILAPEATSQNGEPAETEYLGCWISTVDSPNRTTQIECRPRMPKLTSVESSGSRRDKVAILQSIFHAARLRTADRTWAQYRIRVLSDTTAAGMQRGLTEDMAKEALWKVGTRLRLTDDDIDNVLAAARTSAPGPTGPAC